MKFDQSAKIMSFLSEHECPAITSRRLKRAQLGGVDVPIVWKKTKGLKVLDVDNNVYLDFTAGFGVMALGYSHQSSIKTIRKQINKIQHTMGDAYCSEEKSILFQSILEFLPNYLGRFLLGVSGSDSIEAAIKTVLLYSKNTNKRLLASFSGSYHGLGIGALSLTRYKESFRDPFLSALNPSTIEIEFPDCPNCPYKKTPKDCNAFCLKESKLFKTDLKNQVAAIFIELIQGRGGIRIIPKVYMDELVLLCKKHSILIIVDEIFTGFYRCGSFLLSEEYKFEPDIVILGKGLSGGLPISMMVAKEEVMSSWGDSNGESIHTSTFLGNPIACSLAINVIKQSKKLDFPHIVNKKGRYFIKELYKLKIKYPDCINSISGRGLMIGISLTSQSMAIQLSKSFLLNGIIILPCGQQNNILSITPPLIIKKKHIDLFINILDNLLKDISC